MRLDKLNGMEAGNERLTSSLDIQPHRQLRGLIGALGSPHVDEKAVLGLAVPVIMLRAQADGAKLAVVLVEVSHSRQRRRPYLARILRLVFHRRVPRCPPSQVVQRRSGITHAKILTDAIGEGVALVSGVIEVDFGPWRWLTKISDQEPDEYGQRNEH